MLSHNQVNLAVAVRERKVILAAEPSWVQCGR